MVDVAQLVRASVCGTEGRGFESRQPPHSMPGCGAVNETAEDLFEPKIKYYYLI